MPQAINTGDGLFALARATLWDILEQGVEATIAVRLGSVLDHTVLIVAEGQHLDISFETRQDISVAMYVDMISRKTAALMSCAAEMGALLGTRDQATIDSLQRFGKAIGIAFQVRDDILGIWATSAESGKTSAGDIYRRKKSLPIIHALEHAHGQDQQLLHDIYQHKAPITAEQVAIVTDVFEHTQTRAYCRAFLAQYCQLAYEALASVPRSGDDIATRALKDMYTMLQFIEEAAY